MIRKVHIIFVLVSIIGVGPILATEDDESSDSDGGKGHGLGEHYNWVSLSEGLEMAKEQDKPLMLIIHKSWCGACRALKPKFAKSEIIKELSEKFIMVNTMDDDEPSGDIYQPDGGYIPRVLFFSSNGDLLRKIYNENGNPQYKYYYYDDEAIAGAMRRVLAKQPEARSGSKSEL